MDHCVRKAMIILAVTMPTITLTAAVVVLLLVMTVLIVSVV